MRFYINILTTYFPDIDPPYDVYYRQILEQIELAEELGKLIFEIKVLNTSVVYFREMAERLVKSECSGPH